MFWRIVVDAVQFPRPGCHFPLCACVRQECRDSSGVVVSSSSTFSSRHLRQSPTSGRTTRALTADQRHKTENTKKISRRSFRANSSYWLQERAAAEIQPFPSQQLPPLPAPASNLPLKGNIVFCLTVHACVIHRCREGDLHSGQPHSRLRHGPLREEDRLSQEGGGARS